MHSLERTAWECGLGFRELSCLDEPKSVLLVFCGRFRGSSCHRLYKGLCLVLQESGGGGIVLAFRLRFRKCRQTGSRVAGFASGVEDMEPTLRLPCVHFSVRRGQESTVYLGRWVWTEDERT